MCIRDSRAPDEIKSETITLFPGEVILATTREFLKMPRDVAVSYTHLRAHETVLDIV